MRNLQKILALVLALVMSLSLMATAGARDFTDGDQIDETFAESVDVLTGLEVFQGYPSGDFQPKGDITRAEVAAIIYRIATGDVTDSQVGIYADYNKFSDVPSDNWAAGYINYCANAEYIKGRGDGKFYPQDKVTGYEALAMILRVVGYDKNGEFTGADWQVQTAATANQRKVTKNVNAGTLGNPASRETVAELLCQAILIEKVNYTLAFGYQISTDPKDTIAYETFKMERLTGVVTGNEKADLENTSTMPTGQTRLVNADGTKTLANFATGLDEIGLSVRAYVVPEAGTTRSKLVTAGVYETEENHVYEDGAYVGDIASKSFADNGINSITGAEHFINFDPVQKTTSDWRVEYVIDLYWSEYALVQLLKDNGGWITTGGTAARPTGTYFTTLNGSWDADDVTLSENLDRATSNVAVTYHKAINANKEFTAQDISFIKDIFNRADREGAPTYVVGEVYVGTSSIANKEDVSDNLSYPQFEQQFLKIEQIKKIESNGRGNTLKVVDNDNDGIADYVLQTIYTVDKAASVTDGNIKLNGANQTFGTHSKNDNVNEVKSSTSGVNEGEDEIVAGDVVIYALIDGTARIWKAGVETAKVTTIDRVNSTIKTEGDKDYTESWVHAPHANYKVEGLNSGVTNMVIGTNYTMYFDRYGYLAAFTEGNIGGFVLVTDGWYNNTINGNEYAVKIYNDETGLQEVVTIANGGPLFVGQNVAGMNNSWGQLKNFGRNNNGVTGDLNNGGSNVKTTVALLDGSTLIPVDETYRYSRKTEMLDMVNNDIPTRANVATSKGQIRDTLYSSMTTTAYSSNAINSAHTHKDGTTVDTQIPVHGLTTTVYYYVWNANNGIGTNTVNSNVVSKYVGYGNIPSIEKKYIEDVYAVGTRATDAAGNEYYTADVVVVELNNNYQGIQGELAFVVNFPVVNSARVAGYGIEQVPVVRGDGTFETIPVDMNRSELRYYNVAGANGGSSSLTDRMPGLYVLTQLADGNYALTTGGKTQAELVRDSGKFVVGYVNKTYATAGSNYTTFYPVDENGAAQFTDEIGKVNTSNTKYYTLDYTSATRPNGSAPLTAVENGRDTVLAEHPLADRNRPDYRNDVDNEYFNSGMNTQNLNEVLVACDGASIIYAISFAEYQSYDNDQVHDHDYAQYLWRQHCAKNKVVNAFSVSFYGVTDRTAAGGPAADLNVNEREITISYATAKAWAEAEANKDATTGLTVTGGEIVHIAQNGVGGDVTIPATPVENAEYVLTVLDKNTNERYDYKLRIGTADTTTRLQWSDGTTTTEIFDGVSRYLGTASNLTNIEAELTAIAPAKITNRQWRDTNGKPFDNNNTTVIAGYSLEIEVTAEDGVTKDTYKILFGQTVANIAAKIDNKTYNLYINGVNGKTNVFLEEEAAYKHDLTKTHMEIAPGGNTWADIAARLLNEELGKYGELRLEASDLYEYTSGSPFTAPSTDGDTATLTFNFDLKDTDEVHGYTTKDGAVIIVVTFCDNQAPSSNDLAKAKEIIEKDWDVYYFEWHYNSAQSGTGYDKQASASYVNEADAIAMKKPDNVNSFLEGTAGLLTGEKALVAKVNKALSDAGLNVKLSTAGRGAYTVDADTFGQNPADPGCQYKDDVRTYTVTYALLDANGDHIRGEDATLTYTVTVTDNRWNNGGGYTQDVPADLWGL